MVKKIIGGILVLAGLTNIVSWLASSAHRNSDAEFSYAAGAFTGSAILIALGVWFFRKE